MPLHWSDARIDQLGPLLGPTLRSLIDGLKREIIVTHAALVPAIAALSQVRPDVFPAGAAATFTKEWCSWAFCILNSRSFELGSGKVQDRALVPFMDLMNHAATADQATVVVGVEDGALCAQAKRDLEVGEELCFQYRHGGDLLQFLFNYGFIPAAASSDAADEAAGSNDEAEAVGSNDEAVYFLVDFRAPSAHNAAPASVSPPGDPLPPCDETLGAALNSLGLPATMQLAIPATAHNPFPDSWIWALRLQAMYRDGDMDHLRCFAKGEVKIRPEQDVAAWAAAADTVAASYEWYEAALEKLRGGSSASDEGDADDTDGSLLRRVYQAALLVLRGTMQTLMAAPVPPH